MGGEYAKNPEVITSPEHGKDIEIEVKIVNLGNPDLLINKLEAVGAELEIPKRRITDTNYNLDENSLPELKGQKNIEVASITDLENLEKIIKFLGFNILNKHINSWIISRALSPQRRTVRIRTDGESLTWTVKSPRVKNSTHDERTELNLSIPNTEVAENILVAIGYQRKSMSEKDRTSYNFNGCLVEINYGPTAPPWGEIEGPTTHKIFETAKILGYGESDLASMSDGDYYKMHGIKKEDRQQMTFKKFKNKQNE